MASTELGAVFFLVRVGHIAEKIYQSEVSLEPRQPVRMEAGTVISLYCRVVLAYLAVDGRPGRTKCSKNDEISRKKNSAEPSGS